MTNASACCFSLFFISCVNTHESLHQDNLCRVFVIENFEWQPTSDSLSIASLCISASSSVFSLVAPCCRHCLCSLWQFDEQLVDRIYPCVSLCLQTFCLLRGGVPLSWLLQASEPGSQTCSTSAGGRYVAVFGKNVLARCFKGLDVQRSWELNLLMKIMKKIIRQPPLFCWQKIDLRC